MVLDINYVQYKFRNVKNIQPDQECVDYDHYLIPYSNYNGIEDKKAE